MIAFDISAYPSGLARLLTVDDEAELGTGRAQVAVKDELADLDLDAAFGPRQVADHAMAAACHSGLWLLHNFLDESHALSQKIASTSGSFWHGIMHRREGDYSNAKYWFRRVGSHPVFMPLGEAASTIAPELFQGGRWDASHFVDLCQAAMGRQAAHANVLRRVARREWELLFDYCYRQAIGEK